MIFEVRNFAEEVIAVFEDEGDAWSYIQAEIANGALDDEFDIAYREVE